MSKESDFVDLLNKEMYELKIADLESKLAESEEQLKEELVEKKGLERALSACNRQNDEFAEMIKKLVSEKEELKQQLAEKEKEIEYQESMKILAVENKNKKAIEQLEKVKEHNDNLICDDEDYYNYITAFIDNQIKQLKEVK